MLLLIFIATLAVSLVAHWHVKRTFARHSRTVAESGYTGAEVAYEILQRAGVPNVEIVEHDELLGDHYDPRRRRLVLSSQNFHGISVAALAVAAHEAGHALQHRDAYAPLQLRMAAVGITSIASQLLLWIPLLGMFTGLLATQTGLLIMAAAWGVMMLFNLITLPVEFDASRRAAIALNKHGFIRVGPEADSVNRVLNAAALTYVAAFITSLVYLLWHLLPLLTGRQRD